ncbi:hypothetical protein CRE_02327 [Caenorhabditis remanei]|uniref:Uncharacterized protein n=1 Tax=Caenorhabditis remanei TaxID=31234 RepID=E3MIH5_CAERE|nr:hypothetical protein CRE_02327 [Caenorhabditis remanei]
MENFLSLDPIEAIGNKMG